MNDSTPSSLSLSLSLSNLALTEGSHNRSSGVLIVHVIDLSQEWLEDVEADPAERRGEQEQQDASPAVRGQIAIDLVDLHSLGLGSS